MHLLLGQLVYTSFPEMGFKTLASEQVPTEVEQAFIEGVVSKHWDAYNPPKSGYRAVYLYQVATDHNLFGWLYNDGADDMGRSHVPYFQCYYLAQPLLDFQLENIFTCLHKGPVSLIDRHNPPDCLETIVVPDLWHYQPTRPGVGVPLAIRARCHIALKHGELLDLLVPIDEPDRVIKLNGQTYDRQIGNLSTYTRYRIEGIETGAVDLNEERTAIEDGGIIKYPEYRVKLQRYEQALVEAIERERLIDDNTRNKLKRLQQVLRLRDRDVELIEARIFRQTKAIQPLNKVAAAIKSQDVTRSQVNEAVISNQANTVYSVQTQLPEILSTLHFNQSQQESADRDSVLAYKNSQLLLKAGIATTILALFGSIYGLIYTSNFPPSKSDLVSSYASSHVFYKTLASVPNVPQGLFNYGGSTTFAPLRSKAIVSAINQAQPKFQLRYAEQIQSLPGSGTGIKMLLGGKLSFAQSSRPLKAAELDIASSRGFSLEQIPVAIDGIAFYVNPIVSVPGLSLSQLRDIFTGKITNWKAVGGPDLQITPFSRNLQASGTVDVFKEKVLKGEEFSATVQEVETTTDSIRKVAKTPGGIGYATASEVIEQQTVEPLALYTIHSLPLSKGERQAYVPPFAGANLAQVNKTAFANGSYPLTRPLFVIIKRDGGIDEQAGIAYANLLLTDEGQHLVEKAGFVSIR